MEALINSMAVVQFLSSALKTAHGSLVLFASVDNWPKLLCLVQFCPDFLSQSSISLVPLLRIFTPTELIISMVILTFFEEMFLNVLDDKSILFFFVTELGTLFCSPLPYLYEIWWRKTLD